jgi:hypothetical protein
LQEGTLRCTFGSQQRPTKHCPFRTLHDDCDDSCWSLFFPAFSQQLTSHGISSKPCCDIIDVSLKNSHVPFVDTKLCFDYLSDLLLARFVVEVLFWLCAHCGKPCNFGDQLHINLDGPIHPENVTMYSGQQFINTQPHILTAPEVWYV